MRILLVTPFLPYSLVPHAGGQEINQILRHISVRHEVYLVSRIEPEQLSYLDELRPLCKHIELHHFKTPSTKNPFRIPLIILSYIRLSRMANKIIQKNDFDIIQVEYVETGLAIRRKPGAAFVLDAHDVMFKPAMRRYKKSRTFLAKVVNFLKFKATIWAEGMTINKFDRVFTRSSLDREMLLKTYNYSGKVDVLPHPVSPSAISYNLEISRDPATLLFIGSMDRDVNVDSVLFINDKVLPLIQDKVQNLKFYIIGDKAPQKIKDLARRNPVIDVTGFVNDLLPYYQRATLVVTPLFIGGGIIVKNVEAMANGIPVITTAIGNEGIGAVHGRDLLVAETPDEFAKAIIELLESPAKMKTIGENGREFVEKHFHINAVFVTIDKIYSEIHEKI